MGWLLVELALGRLELCGRSPIARGLLPSSVTSTESLFVLDMGEGKGLGFDLAGWLEVDGARGLRGEFEAIVQ